MPLQNRVTPTGDIVADPARNVMGNRGILHDASRRLGAARWRRRSWICCRLSFKNRRRAVMAPRRYTELFFLDEATALAAGIARVRCRREASGRFRRRHGGRRSAPRTAPRQPWTGPAPGAGRAAHAPPDLLRSPLDDLPDGVFVLLDQAASASFGPRRSPAALARLRLRFLAPPAGRDPLPRADARADRCGCPGRVRAGAPSFGRAIG